MEPFAEKPKAAPRGRGRKVAVLGGLLALGATAWIADRVFPHPLLIRAAYTFAVLAAIYFALRIAFEEAFGRRVQGAKARYAFQKTTGVLSLAVSLIAIVALWSADTQALLLSYGIIGAGIAIALQDLFRNFVGGITLFLRGPFRVGDRIEIESVVGDVIDIGILYTTLLELRGWVGAEQATGRLTTIPNGHILSRVVHNYTRDHNFVWDEMRIPITYDSDWKEAAGKIQEIVRGKTAAISAQADEEIERIGERYLVSKREVEPRVFLALTSNWIDLTVRYVVDVKERRKLRDELSRLLLDELKASKSVRIASETFAIVDFPEVRVKQP